jgi:hypothetical protein
MEAKWAVAMEEIRSALVPGRSKQSEHDRAERPEFRWGHRSWRNASGTPRAGESWVQTGSWSAPGAQSLPAHLKTLKDPSCLDELKIKLIWDKFVE